MREPSDRPDDHASIRNPSMSSSRLNIGLRQLLDLPLDEFFGRVWEQEPRLARGAIARTRAEILTLDDFEALMVSPASGLSIVEGFMARPVATTDEPGRLALAYDAYHRRCTLLQSGLQRHWLPLAEVCRDVENEMLAHGLPLAEGVGANAYLTPGHAQGFDIHYDNHCALVLQLEGTKRWTVFAPRDELPVARCTRKIPRRELAPPLFEIQLAPGDVLYVPRGFPHCAAAEDESSLHVTLSLRAMTWAEAIHAVCESDPAFRHSIMLAPRGAAMDAQAYCVRELLPRLARIDVQAAMERRLAEARTRLAPLPHAGLRAIDAARTLALDTLVVRTPRVICSASIDGDEALLRFAGAALRLPVQMFPVFEFIARYREFSPDMLPAVGSTYDRVLLVQGLVKRGLLYPKETGLPRQSREIDMFEEAM